MQKYIQDTTVDYTTIFHILDAVLEEQRREIELANYMRFCRWLNLQESQPWLPDQRMFAEEEEEETDVDDYDIPNFSLGVNLDEDLDDLPPTEPVSPDRSDLEDFDFNGLDPDVDLDKIFRD